MDQGHAHSGTQALSAARTIALSPLRYDLLFILLRSPGLWLAHVGVQKIFATWVTKVICGSSTKVWASPQTSQQQVTGHTVPVQVTSRENPDHHGYQSSRDNIIRVLSVFCTTGRILQMSPELFLTLSSHNNKKKKHVSPFLKESVKEKYPWDSYTPQMMPGVA